MLTVVVDTEEEFDWDAPFNRSSRKTENIGYQPLAQSIMDKYGVVPTYVVDFPVADTESSAAILRSIARDGRCEIGAHLHPWVNPPFSEVVNNIHSYPGNLPPELERAKLSMLAARITDAFGERPTIYKAGRYGVGPATYEILGDLGFTVDTSIVPFTDFSPQDGPNFETFPSHPFKAGPKLLALPHAVHFMGVLAASGPTLYPHLSKGMPRRLRLPGIASRLGLLERLQLTPEGHSLNDMIRQTSSALAKGERYFMLTYHSSSLLPGATSYVRSEEERTGFLGRLESYLSFFLNDCAGISMSVSALATKLIERSYGSI